MPNFFANFYFLVSFPPSIIKSLAGSSFLMLLNILPRPVSFYFPEIGNMHDEDSPLGQMAFLKCPFFVFELAQVDEVGNDLYVFGDVKPNV